MGKQLNVLMVDPWTGNDYSGFLCANLKYNGVNVTLVVNEDRNISSNGFDIVKMLPSKDKVHSKSDKIIKYISYLSSLYAFYKKNNFNFLHFQSFRRKRVETFFFYFLSLVGVKLIYTVHDIDPLDHSKIDRLLNKIIYKSADVLLAHSETNKRLLKENYNIADSKISIVPHGSFEGSIIESGITGADARKYFGLEQKANVILFFGSVKEYKGIDLLISAAAKASESVKDLVLVIAGYSESEQLKNRYLKQIERTGTGLRIISHFKFIESKEVAIYFKASDVVVLPYRIISHSGVLHLAYSFAKPVIASRTGDFEEFVHEGETGFLFNINDENDLCSVLIKAFNSGGKLKQMGECAKNINSEKYSWDLSAKTLKKIYESLNRKGAQ